MLKSIWNGLNARQETILRHMAELSKPEDIEWIHECVKNEIKSWNQFRRTFESLQSLSLVVETRGKLNQKEFDLHPIIRSFIKSEYYSRREREPFLNRVIWMVETFISRYGKSVSVFSPISLLEYWVLKAELEIQKGDIEKAIETLVDVGEKLVKRGMPGDFFRVSEMLMIQLEGGHQRYVDFPKFHDLNRLLAHTYAEYGRKDEARRHTVLYESMVPKDTAQYISVCDVRCYVEWLFGEFEEAIHWGKEGVSIKETSQIDTEYDSSYHLALAQRDSGRVAEALEYFLDGYSVEEVLEQEADETPRNASFFGNIGRCLHFDDRLDEALSCYVKSAQLLLKKEDSLSLLNRGFAFLWIGEVLERRGDYNNAFMFYKMAELVWAQRAPLKSPVPEERLEAVRDKVSDTWVLKATESGLSRACISWIRDFDRRKE